MLYRSGRRQFWLQAVWMIGWGTKGHYERWRVLLDDEVRGDWFDWEMGNGCNRQWRARGHQQGRHCYQLVLVLLLVRQSFGASRGHQHKADCWPDLCRRFGSHPRCLVTRSSGGLPSLGRRAARLGLECRSWESVAAVREVSGHDPVRSFKQ